MKPPAYPQDGKPVADTIKEIIDYCKATTITSVQGGRIKQSRGGTTLVIPKTKERKKPRPLPFDITLGGDGSTWFVTVAMGYVVERALSAGDTENALVMHECDNRLNEDDNPTKFTIAVGEAIFVQVLEDEFGRVKGGTDLVLVVDAATEESRNFIPGGGDGITLYKLAELVARGTSVELKYVLSGSHIFHSTGLTADFRIMNCPPEPEVLPTQLVRLSFVSGKLHSVGESVEVRPLATTLEEKGFDVEVCT
jgi:hypothetical protein